ncbi:MAG: hypothetical protein QM302_06735 [Acidobacteriota bacterium]|nr:hypothetical protein [Acidobacteriota bacterium]
MDALTAAGLAALVAGLAVAVRIALERHLRHRVPSEAPSPA